MSGPQYCGLIVEKWSRRKLGAVKDALGEVISTSSSWNESPANAYELRVHARAGSAWLTLEDCVAQRPLQERNFEPLAFAVAKATGSAGWIYDYLSTSAFGVSGSRCLPDGKTAEHKAIDERTRVPAAERKKGFDFTRWAEDSVSALIRKQVDWPASLFRTADDAYDGPAIVNEVEGEMHALEAFIQRRAPPRFHQGFQHQHRLSIDELLARFSALSGTLGEALERIDKALAAKDVDRYLSLTESSDLEELFGALKLLAVQIGSSLAGTSFALPPLDVDGLSEVGPEFVKILQDLQARDGKPRNIAQARVVLGFFLEVLSARDEFTRIWAARARKKPTDASARDSIDEFSTLYHLAELTEIVLEKTVE